MSYITSQMRYSADLGRLFRRQFQETYLLNYQDSTNSYAARNFPQKEFGVVHVISRKIVNISGKQSRAFNEFFCKEVFIKNLMNFHKNFFHFLDKR
jgi:hypothetical protein